MSVYSKKTSLSIYYQWTAEFTFSEHTIAQNGLGFEILAETGICLLIFIFDTTGVISNTDSRG